ncbi:MAG TPA: flagellar hook capping FlgD N-terminal domain-containing protein [candidate division Zixibacteria bacterium]|nr:flagellar hook capping FlgD N-terminal domain-containing protein [candidate division Zixibacteria bacterium]
MTEIPYVTYTTTSTTDTTTASSDLGKDEFLQLLVTKLENQDPLDPTDDTDFIAQLAQFSSLEQMSNIADAITESNEWDYLQMQSINNTMSSTLIGRDVKATFTGVYVEDGEASDINYTTDIYATEITFTITDEDGNTVTTLTAEDVVPGVNSIEWDGRDSIGNRVDDGYYYIEATATAASGETFEPSMELTGTVEKITYRDGGAYLTVNGVEVALGDISEIAESGGFDEE